jgi:hypothetical protein
MREILGAELRYFPGSIITVEEVVVLETQILDYSVLDIDNNWYHPRYYLGTYQIFETVDQLPLREVENEGFIVGLFQRWRRYSRYLVTGVPGQRLSQLNAMNISDCSFALQPDVVFDPGQNIPINGALKLHRFSGSDVVLKGRSTVELVPLRRQEFYSQIPEMGFHLMPGVAPVGVQYEVSAINELVADLPAFESTPCYTAIPSCEEQYNALVAQLQAGGLQIIDAAECSRLGPFLCQTETFTCITDPTYIRPIYSTGSL